MFESFVSKLEKKLLTFVEGLVRSDVFLKTAASTNSLDWFAYDLELCWFSFARVKSPDFDLEAECDVRIGFCSRDNNYETITAFVHASLDKVGNVISYKFLEISVDGERR